MSRKNESGFICNEKYIRVNCRSIFRVTENENSQKEIVISQNKSKNIILRSTIKVLHIDNTRLIATGYIPL